MDFKFALSSERHSIVLTVYPKKLKDECTKKQSTVDWTLRTRS